MNQRADAPFARLRSLFERALEQSSAEREVWLAELEIEDARLAQGLRRLLAQASTMPGSPALELPLGARFGPFALQEQIGAGGMGRVYRAQRVDGEFAQTVALKLIAPGFETPTLRDRFKRERQILARLEHPHIAHLIDGGVNAQGQLWLALELVDGQPIHHWCRARNSALMPRLRLFLDLCSAVAHAHRHLVLHRDIKPANVLVDTAGRLKLLDFGIASLLEDTDEACSRTRQIAMSVRYAAPEQVREQRCTTATDVYALGMLLFELLSGRSPFALAEAGQQSWADAALTAQPGTLRSSAVLADVPYSGVELRLLDADLQAIVRRALAKAPTERYASVMALADDVLDVLEGRTARSGVGGRRAALQVLLKRYRWPLSMIATVLLTLLIGVGVAVHEAREARAQSRRAEANFTALLSVLGAASPLDYVGREPVASEFLSAAAIEINQRLQLDPSARWRALEEIGHGLINLGRPEAAAQALQLAQQAQAQDPQITSTEQLDLLRLLVSALGEPAPVEDTRRAAQHIQRLAQAVDADPGTAADALARAASSMASYDDMQFAKALLQQLDALLAHHGSLSPALLENIERQRGRLWLRAAETSTALTALQRAAQIMQRHPDLFSALRRAEMDQLLVDAYAATGQVKLARTHLAAARPVIEGEYPSEHPERVRWLQSEISVALVASEPTVALELARRVRQLIAPGELAGDTGIVLLLQDAAINLALGDCATASATLQTLGARSDLRHRRLVELKTLRRRHSTQCPAASP